jgi:hypothetical protein
MKKGDSSRSRAVECAIGITVHTGWGACVVVGGSLRNPEIVGNALIELLDGAERFCYHRAAEMKPASVPEWLERVRARALAQARSALTPLLAPTVRVGAIVAKDGVLPNPDIALATHMRIHLAEGMFYRDVFREACQVPCRITPPASLDIAAVGKIATRPWSRDQKLAALAAWHAMGR